MPMQFKIKNPQENKSTRNKIEFNSFRKKLDQNYP